MPILIIPYIPLTNGLEKHLISPCPSAFVYRYQDISHRIWYGTLIITTDKENLNIDSIRIILDVPAESLTVYDSPSPDVLVDTYDNTEYLIEGISKTVRRESRFSVTIVLKYRSGQLAPKLTAYRVNEVTTCSKTNYVGADGQFVFSEPTTLRPSTSIKPQWSGVSHNPSVQIPHQSNIPSEGCGTRVPDVAPLIINGEPSRRGEWPWHGALYASESNNLQYRCGCTLVARRYVITAAHCVTVRLGTEEPIEAHLLLLAFGRTKLTAWNEAGTQNVNADKIIINPQYNSTNLHNDLSIVRLVRPLEITVWVRPICLWTKSEDTRIELLANRTGTIVGWGFRSNGVISESLQHAKIPVVDPITCFYSHTSFYSRYSSPKSFCAGIPGSTSACNGDSGGGMSFPRPGGADIWQLRGVVSLAALDRETNICDINHYVVFTDVAFYLEWINQHVREF